MLLLFLHPCSAVSVGHGLTYVKMEKTLLVEQNYRKTAIRTKAICLWLYWQITHCGTGLAPSETGSQWSCPACRAGRHTDTPCSPVDWELVVHFGIPLLASWFPFFFFFAWKCRNGRMGFHTLAFISVWGKGVARTPIRAESCDPEHSPSPFLRMYHRHIST